MTDVWLTPYSVWQKSSDSSWSGCFEILLFVKVPFCFGLHRKGICTITSFETSTRLEASQLEPFVPQWCYDISVSVHMAINAVLEAACTRGDVQPLWEDVRAESTRIPFGSIFIFYGYCRGSSCFCKYSVHELFYSFIRSIVNCHVHTFDLFLSRLRLRTFGGLKPIVPARPPLLPLQVSLLCVGFVWLRILSGTWWFIFNFLIGFFYICVLLTIINCSGAFFSMADPTLAVKIPFFYLYIYLSSSLFMFLCLLCFWECNINRLVSTSIFLTIMYREFPGKTNARIKVSNRGGINNKGRIPDLWNTRTHYVVFYTKTLCLKMLLGL